MRTARWRRFWQVAAVTASIVLLATVAGASTRSEDTGAGLAALGGSSGLAIATAVTAAEPAAVHAAGGLETAAAAVASSQNGQEANEPADARSASSDEVTPASTPDALTSSVRPGWGCGDDNHTHSGPPGRPNATPPPGCSKH